MNPLRSLTDTVLASAGQKAGLAGLVMQNPRLMQGVIGLLAKDSPIGGLPGLVSQFHNAGLGDALESWLGQGSNKAVSGSQIEEALGGQIINQLADGAGMVPSETSDTLAKVLPVMIDQLTPKGQAQTMDTGTIQSILGGFLKGRI